MRKLTPRSPRGHGSYAPTRGVLKGRRFRSRASYRRALDEHHARPVRTRTQFLKLSDAERETREVALRVLGQMRTRTVSLTRAAGEEGLRREEALRYIGSVLRKAPNGRFVAKPRDHLLRVLEFLTPQGRKALDVTDSRTATKIGAYWNALDKYFLTGDWSGLRPFRRGSIRVGKVTYPFLTDTRTLKRLAQTDEVRFESIYAQVA